MFFKRKNVVVRIVIFCDFFKSMLGLMEGNLFFEIRLIRVELFLGVVFSCIQFANDAFHHFSRFVDSSDVGEEEVEIVGEDVAIGD